MTFEFDHSDCEDITSIIYQTTVLPLLFAVFTVWFVNYNWFFFCKIREKKSVVPCIQMFTTSSSITKKKKGLFFCYCTTYHLTNPWSELLLLFIVSFSFLFCHWFSVLFFYVPVLRFYFTTIYKIVVFMHSLLLLEKW